MATEEAMADRVEDLVRAALEAEAEAAPRAAARLSAGVLTQLALQRAGGPARARGGGVLALELGLGAGLAGLLLGGAAAGYLGVPAWAGVDVLGALVLEALAPGMGGL